MCTKLLKFACKLTPVNKSLFVSFLSGGGSVRTKRIARYVAHGLLTGRSDISAVSVYWIPSLITRLIVLQENYSGLPSLSPIISVLSPAAGSNSLFDIQTNSTTDYEDLGYQVDILGIALSDIEAYVAEERLTSLLPSDTVLDMGIEGSPRKIADKPLTMLEMVKNLMEVVHGKIGTLPVLTVVCVC
jgi:hypothetical protein